MDTSRSLIHGDLIVFDKLAHVLNNGSATVSSSCCNRGTSERGESDVSKLGGCSEKLLSLMLVPI